MPSDSNGIYSLPSGYLATEGEVIQPSQHNPPLEDIAAGLTARLMRSGAAPMTGPFKLADGSAGAPALAFASAATRGFFKTTDGIGVAVGGSQVAEFKSSGLGLSAIDIASATELTDPAVDDILPLYDLSGTANKRITLLNLLKIINALTEDTTPDGATDFLLSFDSSAGTVKKVKPQNLPLVLPRGYIDGCKLSNNTSDATNDIDVASGVCRDATNTFNIIVSALTKRLDATWSAGGGNGMRNSADNSGNIGNRTYHIFAVAKADGTQDIYADGQPIEATALSALQAESGGADYVYARRIGAILRESGNIVAFYQAGERFLRVTPIMEPSISLPDINRHNVAIKVPTGLKLPPIIGVQIHNAGSGSNGSIYVSDPDTADVAGSASVGVVATSYALTSWGQGAIAHPNNVRTNTSAEVAYRAGASSGHTLYIHNFGWIDARGRDD